MVKVSRGLSWEIWLAVPPLGWVTVSTTDELYDSHFPEALRVFVQRGLKVFKDRLLLGALRYEGSGTKFTDPIF